MKATEALKEEHLGILQMIAIMEKIIAGAAKGKIPDADHVAGIIDFLKVFADKCHHGKEERILFPAMERAGVPNENGPIGVMLKEHQLGRKYIAGMEEALNNRLDGKEGASAFLTMNMEKYVSLLKDHIQKEEMILFTIADQKLSEDLQASLAGDFEILEAEKIGAGQHEAFHHLLKNLSVIYL